MAFNSTINTGTTANDGQGDGLRTNMRKLIENDNYLNGRCSSIESDHNALESIVNSISSTLLIRTYFPVSASQRPELLAPDGNSLKTSSTYRIRLNTLETGTVSGAVYLLHNNGASWIQHLVSRNGIGSNYPEISIEGSIVRVKTSHPSNYTVRTIIEEFAINSKNALSFWGADYFGTKRGTNFGIKTETPSYPLDVNGTVRCTSLIQTSDKKFKRNIEQIDGEWALLIFQKLKFCFYDSTISNSKEAGLIAQEVEKIIPEAVMTDTEGNKALNYRFIETIKSAAIQHFIKTKL